jgi:hypothetical protein
MDGKDNKCSIIIHGDGNNHVRTEEDAASGDIITLKPL